MGAGYPKFYTPRSKGPFRQMPLAAFPVERPLSVAARDGRPPPLGRGPFHLPGARIAKRLFCNAHLGSQRAGRHALPCPQRAFSSRQFRADLDTPVLSHVSAASSCQTCVRQVEYRQKSGHPLPCMTASPPCTQPAFSSRQFRADADTSVLSRAPAASSCHVCA